MFERPSSGERAVLVHVNFRQVLHQAELQELSELAKAAGAYPVASVTAQREKPCPKYFIGTGKIEEIQAILGKHSADIVIFNHELSPAQERNVEKVLKCRVLSRTGLILDIFAQRARTFEGKLQVELAQLEHLSTRLVRGWTHLERQKGGIGLRGPGEKQLEVDRRLIRGRIHTIQKRLAKVRQQRQQSRQARVKAAIPTIALVGYTNAGKSTLFNQLTESKVLVANQLFATLDPTLRPLVLPGIGKVVLADTVGFVSHLPHQLVDAFRATLEEVREADLLLHVVDAHDPGLEEKRHQVDAVLTEIGAQTINQLIVCNKADLLVESAHLVGDVEKDNTGQIKKVWISALSGAGLPLLKKAMQGRLSIKRLQGRLHLKPSQGQIRAELYALAAVVAETIDDTGEWHLVVQLTKPHWRALCQKHSELAQQLKEFEH